MNISKLLFVIGIISIVSLAIYLGVGEIKEEVIKCYDKYSNEIIGQSCYSYVNSHQDIISMLLVMVSVLSFSLSYLEYMHNVILGESFLVRRR